MKKEQDRHRSISVLEAAEKEMDYIKKMKIEEGAANIIVRSIYECFRMLGEAILINKGVPLFDHKTCIEELISLEIETKRPLQLLESYRELRNNVNYEGYFASVEEAKDIKDFADKCFDVLMRKVWGIVENDERRKSK
jgi:uncharacterized protein YutE (UPF0331/DUF86 family)